MDLIFPNAINSHTRVLVVGLGRFGGQIGAIRWLCRRGAAVTVTDLASERQLADSLEKLKGLNVRLRLGGHNMEDFLKQDLLVVSPAVPRDSPYLKAASEAGIPITTETNIFLQLCPATVVAITGTAGKSTTTAMVHAVLTEHVQRQNLKRRVWLGGNIGYENSPTLLEQLEQMQRNDWVVMELSSFQCQWLEQIRRSPHIAVVSNFWANHLDRHHSLQAYASAKANIFRFQGPRDVLVFAAENLDRRFWDAFGRPWHRPGGPRCVRFWAEDQSACWQHLKDSTRNEPTGHEKRCRRLNLRVAGNHNIRNAAAALAVADILGIEPRQASKTLENFRGLDHRLQHVCRIAGADYYNDSKSTTPEATVTAMEAVRPRPAICIVGGYDKGLPIDVMVDALCKNAKAVLCIGQTGPAVAEAIKRRCGSSGPTIELLATLDEAVAAAHKLARAGDAVLLSPGFASWDQFADYRQRGKAFCQLVRNLPTNKTPTADRTQRQGP